MSLPGVAARGLPWIAGRARNDNRWGRDGNRWGRDGRHWGRDGRQWGRNEGPRSRRWHPGTLVLTWLVIGDRAPPCCPSKKGGVWGRGHAQKI